MKLLLLFKSNQNKLIRVGWHVLFWVCILCYYSLGMGNIKDFFSTLLENFRLLPFDLTFVYLSIYLYVPKFLLKQKYILFSVFFLFSGLASIFLQRCFVFYILNPEYGKMYPLFSWSLIGFTVFYFSFAILAVGIKVFKEWYKKSLETSNMQRDKLNMELQLKNAELKLLKAQIHPHFLFNTLNNLYGLTLEKSDHAPEVVLKISALLNYMLYDCNAEKVPLKKEIDHIKNYIELEKLRYSGHLSLSFVQNGEPAGIMVAPLLLIPFVENCFKHGVSKLTQNAEISIQMIILPDRLDFFAKNSKTNHSPAPKYNYTEGIGLKNIKQRLILSYPDKHMLLIAESEEYFEVRLKLIFT